MFLLNMPMLYFGIWLPITAGPRSLLVSFCGSALQKISLAGSQLLLESAFLCPSEDISSSHGRAGREKNAEMMSASTKATRCEQAGRLP